MAAQPISHPLWLFLGSKVHRIVSDESKQVIYMCAIAMCRASSIYSIYIYPTMPFMHHLLINEITSTGRKFEKSFEQNRYMVAWMLIEWSNEWYTPCCNFCTKTVSITFQTAKSDESIQFDLANKRMDTLCRVLSSRIPASPMQNLFNFKKFEVHRTDNWSSLQLESNWKFVCEYSKRCARYSTGYCKIKHKDDDELNGHAAYNRKEKQKNKIKFVRIGIDSGN